MSQLSSRELSLCMAPMLYKFFGYSEPLLRDVSTFPGLSQLPIQPESRQVLKDTHTLANNEDLDEEADFMIDDSD